MIQWQETQDSITFDSIPAIVLRNYASKLSSALMCLYCHFLNSGQVPISWNSTKMQAAPKKSSANPVNCGARVLNNHLLVTLSSMIASLDFAVVSLLGIFCTCKGLVASLRHLTILLLFHSVPHQDSLARFYHTYEVLVSVVR